MRIAACQFEISGDIQKNYQQIVKAITDAKEQKADLVVLPECSLSGYPPRDIAKAADVCFEKIDWACCELQKLSDSIHISIIVGTVFKEEGRILNRALIFSPNLPVRKYDKRALWGWDKDNFVPGNEEGIFETDNVKIGVRICYEIRFPEYFRELYREQTDINIVLFCDVSDRDDAERYQMIKGHLQTRAVENVTTTVSVNAISPFQTAPTAIFGKSGQIIAECERNIPGMCIYDFEKKEDNFGEKGRRELSDDLNAMTMRRLIKACGLGTMTGEAVPVSGGLMHKMFKVQTSTGVYAVKQLNPEIMKRPTAGQNFARAEKLEVILEKNDIPIVPALVFDGKKQMEIDGSFFYVFRWQEGKITDWNDISYERAYMAGELQGRIHGIDMSADVQTQENGEKEAESDDVQTRGNDEKGAESGNMESREIRRIDFEAYLKTAQEKKNPISQVLESNIELLKKLQGELNEARLALPDMRAICDDDMDPKNIMWHEGKPFVIDLECLDYGNPVESCLNLALQWSGTVTGAFKSENLEGFFKGYLKAYDNGFRDYDKLYGIAYNWVEWLEYNIRRALGLESQTEQEIKLGENEVINTLERIKYLNSIEDEVKKILRAVMLKA